MDDSSTMSAKSNPHSQRERRAAGIASPTEPFILGRSRSSSEQPPTPAAAVVGELHSTTNWNGTLNEASHSHTDRPPLSKHLAARRRLVGG